MIKIRWRLELRWCQWDLAPKLGQKLTHRSLWHVYGVDRALCGVPFPLKRTVRTVSWRGMRGTSAYCPRCRRILWRRDPSLGWMR